MWRCRRIALTVGPHARQRNPQAVCGYGERGWKQGQQEHSQGMEKGPKSVGRVTRSLEKNSERVVVCKEGGEVGGESEVQRGIGTHETLRGVQKEREVSGRKVSEEGG